MDRDTRNGCRFSFFLIILIIITNITIGSWSVIEILSWFDKSIPLVISIIIGLVFGEFAIPVAVIGILLRLFGVF